MSKVFAACIIALGHEDQAGQYDKADNTNGLLGNLRKMFERAEGRKFVAIIEDVDELKQPGSTLLAALARLGDLVKKPERVMTRPLANMDSGTWILNHIDLELPTTTQPAQGWRTICPFSTLL